MSEREFIALAIEAIHEAVRRLQVAMSSSSSSTAPNHVAAVAVGVAITAVAGVAVAAAVGGTLLYSRRAHSKRRKKKRPLTPKQWRDVCNLENGKLADVEKFLRKIRFGGIDPNIRAEVWPFLLGFYDLESTRAGREAEKTRRREEYEDLKRRCNLLQKEIALESRLTQEAEDGFVDIISKDSQHGFSSSSPVIQSDGPSPEVTSPDNSNIVAAFNKDDSLDVKEFSDRREDLSGLLGRNDMPTNQSNRVNHNEKNLQTTEEFVTWQRIIRLDAVRMNAEWVPYSPSQANVTEETASQLALVVGLKDDEHLEPCRQHHAARLVAILEAYSLYDPETGYCQGMSDLLSPFVALLDDDYEAFWCFTSFMRTARHNFRLDEVGIRQQLNMVSSILRASDPHLFSHLVKIRAEDCTFVYRMVVVLLRRELSFEQTISLWEVIWADKTAFRLGKTKTSWRKGRRRAPSTKDLLLYVIAAAVRQKRKFIIEHCRGMDDILRECNGMAGHLDVWALLDDARELVIALHEKVSN